MRYRLQALPFADDLAYYRDVGRGVSIQWLNLSDAEATRLASALAENAKPENARYGYDYFTDNCATRVKSEEHTTELQSLMRISSAVFCSKKKTILTNSQAKHHTLISH